MHFTDTSKTPRSSDYFGDTRTLLDYSLIDVSNSNEANKRAQNGTCDRTLVDFMYKQKVES